jgi:hypothetical protein
LSVARDVVVSGFRQVSNPYEGLDLEDTDPRLGLVGKTIYDIRNVTPQNGVQFLHMEIARNCAYVRSLLKSQGVTNGPLKQIIDHWMALGLVSYTKYTSVMRLVLKYERNPCWYEADPELLRTKSGRPPTLTEKMRERYVTDEVVDRGGQFVHGGKAAKYVEAKRREGLQFRVEHADVSTALGRANRLGALKGLAGKGSVQTTEVHVAMVSLDSRVKVIRKAMDKSGPRYLAEHSLFGALNTAIRTT